METRDDQGIEVRRERDIVVTTSGTDVNDGPPPAPPRGRLLVGLVALLALALVTTLVLVLVLGGDDGPVTAQPPAGKGAAAPTDLGMTVELPDPVVAGEAAAIVVRWSDGEGVFSGSSEEWGDGVGTSSLAQDQCAGVTTDKQAAGQYTVKHTWTEPGTYQVVLGVATYTCQDGSAVEEQASKTVSVQVQPAG